MTRRIPAPRRAAFTVIELLVVIAIIAILVALTTAGVQQVRISAKRAALASEIAQIGNAVGAFKSKFNATYLPSFSPASGGGTGFRLCSNYHDSTNSPTSNFLGALLPEATYLKQLFPQMESVQANGNWDNGLRLNGMFITNGVAPAPSGVPSVNGPITLDPNQALLFFLTGSSFTNFQGFSTNKVTPFATPSGQAVGPFLEVNASKLDAATPAHYLDPFGSPYAYFSFDPNTNTYPAAGSVSWNGSVCVAYFTLQNPAAPVSPSNPPRFLNQKGFQIISAGKNGVFGAVPGIGLPGNHGYWTPGTGDWGSNGPGGDDMSNFNNGQLVQQSAN